jgi:hypothetical protein
MSRNEVKSLNDLAMAHGGQLTINPQTGLPEAGFLSSLLPMVAGAALNAAFPGLGTLGSAALVGGGSMLLNPKAGLMGGLMAGLGAYGGAGLGQGLSSLGATSEAGLTSGAATQAGEEAAKAELAKQQALQEAAKQSVLSSPTAQNIEAAAKFTPDYMQNAAQSARDYAANSFAAPPPASALSNMGSGLKAVFDDPSKLKDVGGGSYMGLAKMGLAAAAPAAPAVLKPSSLNMPGSATAGKQIVPHYGFTPGMVTPTPAASATGVENTYFQPKYTALTNEQAQQMYPGYPDYTKTAANGGIMSYAAGGPVEQMSNNATIGANTMYPMANMATSAFATPYQDPRSTNMMAAMNPSGGGTVDAMSGEPNMQGTRLAAGGISDAGYNLGGYSDGGRLLRGPGDGVSDSIPATIGHKQPARLADGEFVVPARIVSELGNGSTEAGARKLYAMMDKVQASRRNTIGKGKVAKNNRADKYLPA